MINFVIFCDAVDSESTRALFLTAADVIVVDLVNGPGLQKRVREMAVQHKAAFFVSFCVGGAEDTDRVEAKRVAALLEGFNVAYGGCRVDVLGHSNPVLRMMAFYADVRIASFVEIGDSARDKAVLAALAFPVEVEGSDRSGGEAWRVVAANAAELDTAVTEGLLVHPQLVASELHGAGEGSFNSSMTVVATGDGKHIALNITHPFALAEEYARKIATSIFSLSNIGYCVVRVSGLIDGSSPPVVTCIRPGCTASDFGASSMADMMAVIHAVEGPCRRAWSASQRSYHVVFDPSDLGFHLRASRGIKNPVRARPVRCQHSQIL